MSKPSRLFFISDFNALFRYLLKHFPATPNLKQLFGKQPKPNAPPPSGTTPAPATTTTPESKKDVSQYFELIVRLL